MTRLKILHSAALIAWACFPTSAEGAFTIQFDYTYDVGNFFSNGSAQRNLLETAADFFEGIISDDLDAISPGGSDSWGMSFEHPSSEGTPVIVDGFFPPTFTPPPVIPADTLIVYVGANNLANNALGKASAGTATRISSNSGPWYDTVTTRGEIGVGLTDFAPWGGSLSMDTDTNWDYSQDGSTLDITEYHFYSVLLHEMAHVLGYGSAASWTAQVNGSNQFTGAAAVTMNGGNVDLEAGSGHWLDGTTSTLPLSGASQEAALDPILNPGEVKLLTMLDIAALQDIGWEIAAPVPEPGVSALLALAAFSLAVRRRR